MRSRLAAGLLLILGCPTQGHVGAWDAASPMDGGRPTLSLARFRTLTTTSTVTDVKRFAGEPDGDLGSGIFMYFWKLDDGTRVVVGTPDKERIVYVDWKKADGTTERLVGTPSP
jgi:hypothetical protein